MVYFIVIEGIVCVTSYLDITSGYLYKRQQLNESEADSRLLVASPAMLCSTNKGHYKYPGMRSSTEISLESLQQSGREDFEWQDTVSDTLNWLQATSIYGN